MPQPGKPKETFPGKVLKFPYCYIVTMVLENTFFDNPKAWHKFAHGAGTIVNTKTGCGQGTPSEVCLEVMGHPSAAGLSIGEQVQACAFILIHTWALSNWPGPQKSVPGEETLCPGPLLQAFFPIMEPEPELCGTPVSPVFSPPRASAGDLDCLIPRLCCHSKAEAEKALIKHK